MVNTNLSQIIQRVASTCINIPFTSPSNGSVFDLDDDDDELNDPRHGRRRFDEEIAEEEEEEEGDRVGDSLRLDLWEEDGRQSSIRRAKSSSSSAPAPEMTTATATAAAALMAEVFVAVSALKRAYASLQAAHSPWDANMAIAADAAMVAELRKLDRLRDAHRRAGAAPPAPQPLQEAVAPYEAAIDDLKRDLRAGDLEIQTLKEKLRHLAPSMKKKNIRSSGKRSAAITAAQEARSASNSFSSLLSLMTSAGLDVAAAVRSIISDDGVVAGAAAEHVLESYINRRVFHGFENESFYIDGGLSSLIDPAAHRRSCFAQYRDMKGMDPSELLGVLPSCPFGVFAARKYGAVVGEKMEEAMFGGSSEQRAEVIAGGHPRTEFYGEFLRVAKAVWMMHLLAFAMDPTPTSFEARKGAEFRREYMEDVSGDGAVVGFAVAPGFRLGNGSVVRARVYLVPSSSNPKR